MRIRVASLLVMIALIVELASLGWSHPLSFIVFATVGGAALGAGIVLYLTWLIAGRSDKAPAPPEGKE